MSKGAKEGMCLAALIQMAIPICRQAEQQCPRTGPGRKPEIPDWVIMVLIVVAILKQRKSKSSQYRYLAAHRAQLLKLLGTDHFPSRSTYFDRYLRAWQLLEVAIRIAGEEAIQIDRVDARCVAVDKSVIRAQGPLWNQRHLARGRVPRGADLDATWTFSSYEGWALGYSYEVVVSAEKEGVVWPLLASAGPASWQPNRTFPAKIFQLPQQTRYVLADSGYDSNDLAEAIECFAPAGKTRRLLCPQYIRGRPPRQRHKENKTRKQHRLQRAQRKAFFERRFAQRLIRRRGARIEPFNDWLKTRFDLHHHAWHRGLNNNRTQLLGAIFSYQLLLTHNHERGNANGQIQWILDEL